MMYRFLVVAFLMACGMGQASAASLQYVNPGTAITFQDSGGTAVLTFASKGNNLGQISDRADLGDPHSPWYILTCTYRGSAATTVGNRIEYYLAWSAATTHPDGEKGSTNSALTATNEVLNMKPALTVILDKTTGNTADITGSTLVNIPTRYVQLAYWNVSGVSLSGTANQNTCSLTEAPLEQQ